MKSIKKSNSSISILYASVLCIASMCIMSLFIISCGNNNSNADANRSDKNNKIRVGVFDGHGGAQTCVWETLEACRLDSQIDAKYITTSDIAHGVLDSLDAIVIPGGGGSRQYLNLGGENIDKIKQFVANGGGAVGICAGAYLFSNTPDYSCIALNDAKAIDIEHDNRGHGIAAFALNNIGRTLFPEYANIDTLYCMYYEGPVYDTVGFKQITDLSQFSDSLQPAENVKYITFATMISDVHTEGNAPSNMTNARPFFIGNNYGKGRVFSSIAHPEATPGKMWMISRMVRWVVDTSDTFENVVNQHFENPDILQDPTIANKEILMSIDDLKKESSYFKVFLYGTAQEKVEALDWLEAHFSWDAKRWIQGLLFDESSQVRVRAAEYIANTHYLKYKKDVFATLQNETDSLSRSRIEKAYNLLDSLR